MKNEIRSIVFTSARLREYYNPTRSHIETLKHLQKKKSNILANSLQVTCKSEMKSLLGPCLVIMPSNKEGLSCTKDISGTKYGPKGEHLQMIALIKNLPFR